MTIYEPNSAVEPTGNEAAEFVDNPRNEPGAGHAPAPRKCAVVTGASRGIGKELARQFAEHGFDVVIASETEEVYEAAQELTTPESTVRALQVDLATDDGVEKLAAEVRTMPVDALVLNAGVGVSGAFVDTPLERHLELIDLNVRGAVQLTGRVRPAMVERGRGGLLFTSSIAATTPGAYMSTYNASKGFLASFAEGLRVELKDRGVTVTALMPGPTDTDFFERAGMEDTKLGQAHKDDPADVARDGFEAFIAGKDHVVAGSVKNKIQANLATHLPDRVTAEMHAKMAEPGSGDK